jgi:hypothetical protein
MAKKHLLKGGVVLALAGRRIDAGGADPPRFPLSQVLLVRRRIARLLVKESVVAVVCSGACGADLIALEEAKRLGLRRRIVLPFARERFRLFSVVDRPGNWGEIFDRLADEAQATGDLVVLTPPAGDESAAYAAANEAILHQVEALARDSGALCRPMAVMVWEGAPQDDNDATDGFRRLAEAADIAMLPAVLTR